MPVEVEGRRGSWSGSCSKCDKKDNLARARVSAFSLEKLPDDITWDKFAEERDTSMDNVNSIGYN